MIGSNPSLRMPVDIAHEIITYLPHQEKWRFLCVVKDLDEHTAALEKFKLDRHWSELFAKYSAWCLKENPFAIYPLPDTDSSPAMNPLPDILKRCTWYRMPSLRQDIDLHLSNLCRSVVAQGNPKHIKTVIELGRKVPLQPKKSVFSLKDYPSRIEPEMAEVYFPWKTLGINVSREVFRLWANGNKEQVLEMIDAIDSCSGFEDSILCSIAEKFVEQANYDVAESILDLVKLTCLKDRVLYEIILKYVEIGKIDSAQYLADSLAPDGANDGSFKSRALYVFCSHFLSICHYSTARKIAGSIQDEDLKFQALHDICMEYLDTIADYDTAVDIASSMPDPKTEMEKYWKDRTLFSIFLKFLEKKGYDQAMDIAVSISDEHRSKAFASLGLHYLIQDDANKARSIANLIPEDSEENRILKTYLLYLVAMVYLKKDDPNMAMDVASTMGEEKISDEQAKQSLGCSVAPEWGETLIAQVSNCSKLYELNKSVTGKRRALYQIALTSLESGDIPMAISITNSLQNYSSPQFFLLEETILECLKRKDNDNLLTACRAMFENYQCLVRSRSSGEHVRRQELSSTILEKVIPKLLEDNDIDTADKVAHLIPRETPFSELSAKALAMIGK